MNASRTVTLQTDRGDIARTRWHETPHTPLEAGQVRLRVEHFGLSANNVTYATLGEAMNYWGFFPQQDPGWGCVPVWGYATVTESHGSEVPVGQRVFGFLPFATDVVMTPTRIRSGGFVDGAGHRAGLPAPYNTYAPVDDHTRDGEELEAYEALLRPLFTTSFLIADWLSDEQYFGADTVVLSSASSKTAAGTAYALARVGDGPRPVTVGLTSAANVASTRRLGLYDRVLSYDEIDALDPDRPTVYVDLSGSARVRAAVHGRCADLRHDCAVGLTHWQATDAPGPLPGPEPVFFFAPTALERRAEQVGTTDLLHRIGAAMSGFVAEMSTPPDPPMAVTWFRGHDAAATAYSDIVLGRTDPAHAAVVALSLRRGRDRPGREDVR